MDDLNGGTPMAMETSILGHERNIGLLPKIIELGDLPYVSLLAGSSEVVSAGSHETMFFPSDTCILSVGVIFPIFVTSFFFVLRLGFDMVIPYLCELTSLEQLF